MFISTFETFKHSISDLSVNVHLSAVVAKMRLAYSRFLSSPISTQEYINFRLLSTNPNEATTIAFEGLQTFLKINIRLYLIW